MTDALPLLRSALFLPASNPRAVAKARTLDCDAVILDLEDAVGPDEKAAARAAAMEAALEGGFRAPVVAVRVNGLDTPWGADDLRALARAGLAGPVVTPKTGSAEALAAVRAALGGKAPLWASVETCEGLLNLRQIAEAGAALGLQALFFGQNDLSYEMGRRPGLDRRPLHWAMSLLVTTARAHGLAVVDGVFNDFSDLARFEAECREGRDFGFDGKAVIHPAQVGIAQAAFSPDETDLIWARAVVRAFGLPGNEGRGAVRIEGGAMAERLHLRQAERLLAAAERS